MKYRKPQKVSLYNAINLYKLKDRTITALHFEMGGSNQQQAKVLLYIQDNESTELLKYRNNKTTRTD